jgi:hypothetical protein
MAAKNSKKLSAKTFSSRIKKLTLTKQNVLTFAVIFAGIGSAFLLLTHAATPTANLEPENKTVASPAISGNDSNASGGKYVQFKASGSPTLNGAMPTHENTGVNETLTGDISAQQFMDTGNCDHKRVVGDVRLEVWSGSGAPGDVWTANQCVFTGQMFLLLDGFYPESNYFTINFNRIEISEGMLLLGGIKGTITGSELGGGFWSPCPDCTNTYWTTRRAMPISVKDTLFYSFPPAVEDGYHYEALHVMGSSTGLSFDNVRFSIRGPYNNTQTGAILFDADQASFKNVYFDFGGTPAASFYTAYIGRSGSDGTSITMDGCKIEKGLSWYVYPDGTANHDSVGIDSWSNCRDWYTDALLTLH